ncbi:hypothetical protein [Bradyrhizobium genosp. P]|uniref:hypothetical protein n=1 Tax=Bradyrhizobium genosp. P TaxID=83641 RepID=UPI003CE77F26
MPPTPVYIICSPGLQVGKTLTARLLSEFLLLKNGSVLSFDINLREPSLVDYLPNITETADVTDTWGKMQLMDRLILDDGVAKVVDLGFHAFDEFFKMCMEIEFVMEAVRNHVTPIILFVGSADRVSSRSYEVLRHQVRAPALITVHNQFVLRNELPEAMDHAPVLRIFALPQFLKAYIDRLTFSFTGYLRKEKDSTAELHQWIRRNYTLFRDLELRLMRSAHLEAKR